MSWGTVALLRMERFLKGTEKEINNEESGTTETKASHEPEEMEKSSSQRH